MHKRWKRYTAAALVLAVVCAGLAGCGASVSGYALNGYYNIQINEGGAGGLRSKLTDLITTADFYWDVHNPQSDLGRLNETGSTELIDPQTAVLLERAMALRQATDGAFEPFALPLATLWNIQGSGALDWPLPERQAIAQAALAARSSVCVLEGNTAALTVPDGMAIKPGVDTSAMAKGAAVDLCADAIREAGVSSALVDIGRTLAAMGDKKPGVPWRVAVPVPEAGASGMALLLTLTDTCLSTAGQYQCFETAGDVRYGHILDPRAGFPAEGAVASVTVVGPSAMVCQALSNALFVLGAARGEALLQSRFPAYGAAWIFNDRTVYASPALRESISIYENADFEWLTDADTLP